jgi:hypothetical protein
MSPEQVKEKVLPGDLGCQQQYQPQQQQQLLQEGRLQQHRRQHQQQQQSLIAAQAKCRLTAASAATMAAGKLDPVRDKMQLRVMSQVFGPSLAALCCTWGS